MTAVGKRISGGFCYSCGVLGIAKKSWLLMLLSAGLQIVIFPLPNLYFLSWIALAPLLVALLPFTITLSAPLLEVTKMARSLAASKTRRSSGCTMTR